MILSGFYILKRSLMHCFSNWQQGQGHPGKKSETEVFFDLNLYEKIKSCLSVGFNSNTGVFLGHSDHIVHILACFRLNKCCTSLLISVCDISGFPWHHVIRLRLTYSCKVWLNKVREYQSFLHFIFNVFKIKRLYMLRIKLYMFKA